MTALEAQPEPAISEILELAKRLHPRAFFLRIDDWRSGAGGKWSTDLVRSSSTRTIPVSGEDGGLKDRLDRELQKAKRQYRDDLDDARRLLAHACALQERYLFPIEVASADLVDLTSDSPVCRKCKGTKEMWLRDKRKTPWRIKAGLGPCCYSAWNAAGRPDLPPMDAKTMEEAS